MKITVVRRRGSELLLENREISLTDRFDEDDQGMEEKIGDPISPSVEYQIIKARSSSRSATF